MHIILDCLISLITGLVLLLILVVLSMFIYGFIQLLIIVGERIKHVDDKED